MILDNGVWYWTMVYDTGQLYMILDNCIWYWTMVYKLIDYVYIYSSIVFQSCYICFYICFGSNGSLTKIRILTWWQNKVTIISRYYCLFIISTSWADNALIDIYNLTLQISHMQKWEKNMQLINNASVFFTWQSIQSSRPY